MGMSASKRHKTATSSPGGSEQADQSSGSEPSESSGKRCLKYAVPEVAKGANAECKQLEDVAAVGCSIIVLPSIFPPIILAQHEEVMGEKKNKVLPPTYWLKILDCERACASRGSV